MTAPVLAIDAICGSPACHGHRCPRLRHGYDRGVMRGRCSQHRGCRAFELDELAACEPETTADQLAKLAAGQGLPPEPHPTGSPAGEGDDDMPGPSQRPLGDLPGTSPAPVVTGHEAAEPIRGGEAEPAVEVEATTPAEPSTAGRIPLGSAWLCRVDRLTTATAPGVCARCGGPLVRHHIYAEAADA